MVTKRSLLVTSAVVIAIALSFVMGRTSVKPPLGTSASATEKGKAAPAEPATPAVPPPARMEVVHSFASPPALPTTDREPAKVRVEPAYQFEPSATAGYQPRFVPYPGAPYVPPVRPYDPREPRYARIETLLKGEDGELIPVVEERAITSPAPVLIRRTPTDLPPTPPTPTTPSGPAPAAPEPIPAPIAVPTLPAKPQEI